MKKIILAAYLTAGLAICSWADDNTVEIIAAGDIFPSPSLIEGGTNAKGEQNYLVYYKPVQAIIEAADIATAWFGGPVAAPGEKFKGYPEYNNPPGFVTATRDAGFDILLHTNHLLDQGLQALYRTLKFYKDQGMTYLGVYSSEEESQKIHMVEKKGMKIAFLSYLFGANADGIKVPKWLYNKIQPAKIKADIEKAHAQGADFVVVAVHWGTEYKRFPDKDQMVLATNMAQWGADMILGSHPHVIQPADVLPVKGPDGKEKKVFIIYSFGNFLSSQRGRYSDCGLLVRLKLARPKAGAKPELVSSSYIPVWVKWAQTEAMPHYDIRVLPTKKAMEDYKTGADKTLTAGDYEKMRVSLEDTTNLLNNPKIPLMAE